uniref:C2H2-type domain-containing protein n=1 Tax=viral metagenome TaxID=1070528 RepID=A0A6C0BS87_9ZZZZ
MKYYCDHCSYETDKKANYTRHLNRKFRCNKISQNVYADSQNVYADSQNVYADSQNVYVDSQNVYVDSQNVYEEKHDRDRITYGCTLCNKLLSSKYSLLRHEERCKGFKSNQCQICLNFFGSRRGIYQHKRNVLCFPPIHPPPQPLESLPLENALIVKEPITISNIQNNNNVVTTNSHNNNNTTNNIINFNAFGEEGIKQLEEFLGEDKEIIERLKQVGKKQLYGIRDIQNDIFFNPKNPKGFSIIKPEKYGSSVRVRNNEGEFEYMEFEDVRDPMLNYMEKYIEIYNKTRNKYNVKFRDPKERRIVHNFLKIMNDDLDIYLNEDLKEDVDIEDESNECENDDDEMKYKQFDKVSLDNMHVQTRKYFKCKRGEFVLKDKKVKSS